jgi:Tfp pilus assembly protein PilN
MGRDAVDDDRRRECGLSRKQESTLHIEWTPGWVQAVDIATGKSAAATSAADLGPFLHGHKSALVGVGRNLVFIKTCRLPKAAPDDLRRLVEIQLGQLFPLPPDQLAFDCYQTTDQTAEGCLTLVAAMRSSDLKDLRADLQRVGVKTAHILPVALGAPVATAAAGAADALLVEENESGLALDVVQGGVLRLSRMAPPGADVECEAVRTLAAARAPDLPIVTAGAAEMTGASAVAGTALSLLHQAPRFGFVLTEDRAKEIKNRLAARMRLAVLMMLATLLLIVVVWADRSDALSMVKRGEGAWARQLGKLRSMRNAETVRAQKEVAVQGVLDRAYKTAQPLSDMMGVVGDSLPPGAWLTGLTIERGKVVTVRGSAKTSADVGTFVNALAATSRFRDVKLVFANSARIDETPVVQFNVAAVAIGNLPMPEPEKVMARAVKRKPAAK